jgi:hypothetical protein
VRRWAGDLAGSVLTVLRRPMAAERAPSHEATTAIAAEKVEETPRVAAALSR